MIDSGRALLAQGRSARTRWLPLISGILKHRGARAERGALKPLRARVAIHAPCTQLNVLRDAQATQALLACIPQIELIALDPNQRCCGAAGLHFVTDPDAADRFLEPKLAAAKTLAPDFIVSANIGCTLHLAAGLRRAGIKAPVLHPLSLLAGQLAERSS